MAAATLGAAQKPCGRILDLIRVSFGEDWHAMWLTSLRPLGLTQAEISWFCAVVGACSLLGKCKQVAAAPTTWVDESQFRLLAELGGLALADLCSLLLCLPGSLLANPDASVDGHAVGLQTGAGYALSASLAHCCNDGPLLSNQALL